MDTTHNSVIINKIYCSSLLQQNTCLCRKYLLKYIKTVKKLRPKKITYHTKSTELTKMYPWKNRHSPPQTPVPIVSVVLGIRPSPRTTCLNDHLSPL